MNLGKDKWVFWIIIIMITMYGAYMTGYEIGYSDGVDFTIDILSPSFDVPACYEQRRNCV